MNSIKNRLVCNGALQLRRQGAAVNWIALGVLLAAWHFEADLDRAGEVFKGQAKSTLGAAPPAPGNEPYWLARLNSERSWLARTMRPAPPSAARRR